MGCRTPLQLHAGGVGRQQQHGTNTMSVFIKFNGSPWSEFGYAGENIQLVFAGLNKISIFLAYISQTFSIDQILERVGPLYLLRHTWVKAVMQF